MVAQMVPPSRGSLCNPRAVSFNCHTRIVTTPQANQILRPSGGPSAVQQQFLSPHLTGGMMQQQQHALVPGGQPYPSPGGQQQQQQLVRAKMVQHEQLLRQIRAMGRPPNAFALFAASLAR